MGVVENCSYYGTYGDSESEVPGTLFLFFSNALVNTLDSNTNVHLLVKTRLGSGPDFGEKLRTKVRAVVPADQAIRFNVRSLAEMHDNTQAKRIQRLKFTALLSSLLMLMVVLGLTGIMWQNVRRRTREIGVRRAVGAAAGNIYSLFLGELAVLATAAIALGCVPILQFDLPDLLLNSWIPIHVPSAGWPRVPWCSICWCCCAGYTPVGWRRACARPRPCTTNEWCMGGTTSRERRKLYEAVAGDPCADLSECIGKSPCSCRAPV